MSPELAAGAALTTPAQLLAEARRLLDETPAGTAGAWPRAAALLARQALEAALTAHWTRHAPGVQRASMRAQIACLRATTDDETAAKVRFAWHALSRATHHRTYELDPTREELASLVTDATSLSARLDA